MLVNMVPFFIAKIRNQNMHIKLDPVIFDFDNGIPKQTAQSPAGENLQVFYRLKIKGKGGSRN